MLSGIITAVLLVLFVGGWAWLWRPALREPLEAAGRLALESEQARASGQGPDPREQSEQEPRR